MTQVDEVNAMSTLDAYIGKHPDLPDWKIAYWNKVSQEEFGRAIDPREGGKYCVEREDILFVFDYVPLEKYVQGVREVLKLAEREEPVSGEEALEAIAQAQRKTPKLWLINPEHILESANRPLPEGVEERVRLRNEVLAYDILHHVHRLHENYQIDIMADVEEVWTAFGEKRYEVTEELGIRSGDNAYWFGKTGRSARAQIDSGSPTFGVSGAWFHHIDEFIPEGQTRIRLGGWVKGCTRIVLDLAEIVQKKGWAACFDSFSNPNRIAGACYDPSWKKERR